MARTKSKLMARIEGMNEDAGNGQGSHKVSEARFCSF